MTSDLNPPLVLVVDDDTDTRELYRLVLETVGYRVEDVATSRRPPPRWPASSPTWC